MASNGPSTSNEAKDGDVSSAFRQANGSSAPPAGDLIDVTNHMQSKLAAAGYGLEGLELPMICVVGCTSAGKSSILESFIGKELLPRGTGCVTRRPIVIMMHPSHEEYGMFAHKPDHRYEDFSAIRTEIVAETNRHPGPKGFSKDPIMLEIHTCRALKLTVVDLPGMVKVVDDESSKDQVRKMILDFISKPESIILAVTPVNHDFHNSDALDIAKEADPEGVRTIGVLTKLDIMDEGTDATEFLENRRRPLVKGYVGVINRSHMDMTENRDFDYILKKEKDFFMNHPCYKKMAHRMGIPYLQNLLQKTLRQHIKAYVPKLSSDIRQKLNDYTRTLKTLESEIGDPENRQMYMMTLVQNFCRVLNYHVYGNSMNVSSKEVLVGAEIHHKFYTEIRRLLDINVECEDGETTVLVANMGGYRTQITIPQNIVETMNKDIMSLYKDPLERSVESIATLLWEAIEEVADQELSLYQSLKNELLYKVEEHLKHEKQETIDRLTAHVDAEMNYINFEHPDFDSDVCQPLAPSAGLIKIWDGAESEGETSSLAALKEDKRTRIKKKLQSNEGYQRRVTYVTTMITKYHEIIKKQMGDVSIKYISYFLIKKVMDYIDNKLMLEVTSSANMSKLEEDCEDYVRKKEEMEASCRCFREALSAIQNF